MRDRQAERVTEQGGDGEPVGQPADQRRLGARSQQIDPEAGLAQPGGADVDEAHGDQQRRGEAAMTAQGRSEEHTSELQSLMRISYAVFCLKKKKKTEEKNTR